PDQLLDATKSLPERCRRLPIAVRRADRALLPSESGWCGRGDGLCQRSEAVYEPAQCLPASQGVREGLLVQAGRVRAVGGRRRRAQGSGTRSGPRAREPATVITRVPAPRATLL